MIIDALEAKGLTQNWLAEQMKQVKQNFNKKLLQFSGAGLPL